MAVDFPINDFFSLQPGFSFSAKGANNDEYISGILHSRQINLYYMDIPILIKGAYTLENSSKIFVAAGPYIGLGLLGKRKVTTGISKLNSNTEIWGDQANKDPIERSDAGLIFVVGSLVQNFSLSVSYETSVKNISNIKIYNHSVKNRVFKVSLGYWFGE